MNYLLIVLISWFSTSLPINSDPPARCKNSQFILSQSQQQYDASQQWGQSELRLHIQEPRVDNPRRYSRVVVNNASRYFEIEREYAEGPIKQVIDEQGNYRAWLSEAVVPDELSEKYGLNEERGEGYRKFYRTMYGLPMTITDKFYSAIAPAEPIVFEGEEAYRIAIELEQEMISQHWRLIISETDYSLLALEIYHPDEPAKGELIKFEDDVEVGDIRLPRIRHWYGKSSSEYLGSDIIVQTID